MKKKEMLKLKEVTNAIVQLDKMYAAVSYGQSHVHLGNVIRCLDEFDRQALADIANRFAQQRLEEARETLRKFNIDPGTNPRPEEYRIHDKPNTDDGPG